MSQSRHRNRCGTGSFRHQHVNCDPSWRHPPPLPQPLQDFRGNVGAASFAEGGVAMRAAEQRSRAGPGGIHPRPQMLQRVGCQEGASALTRLFSLCPPNHQIARAVHRIEIIVRVESDKFSQTHRRVVGDTYAPPSRIDSLASRPRNAHVARHTACVVVSLHQTMRR